MGAFYFYLPMQRLIWLKLQKLKVFYPNLLHVTCLAHGINRVAEVARELCPGVNKLVNNGKKAFLKAPSRVAIYQEIMPDSPLPPEPIITRWGTWLEAAIFYANNYEKFAAVVRRLEDDAESVKKLKLLIEERSVQNELIFIKTHLCFLPECLKQLENQGMSLYDSISIVQDVKSKIIRIPGEKGKRLKSKLDNVLEKNVGFKTLEQYSTILTGDGESNEDIKVEMIPKFKYAPITSVDVERSFSIYKHILDSRRCNFTEENLEMYIVCNYNA
ncbi:uncharacterized protein LOC116182392 [Photinus pyralis]|uniref:uncharacterized protein LOC116182392 n=1 Tax=Photinus pyralis TaxID=7054 RepID=UPI0012671106|nr:uncharacterized protein LOC116182392 [Photinus pyralis]XP_031358788.1 uncharacterized protein LOC116182392 [Photinus pyralis]